MSGPSVALANLLTLETAYGAWLDLIEEDRAGRRPDDTVVVGTLAWVRSAIALVGQPTADVCWRRVSRPRETAPLASPAVPGAPS